MSLTLLNSPSTEQSRPEVKKALAGRFVGWTSRRLRFGIRTLFHGRMKLAICFLALLGLAGTYTLPTIRATLVGNQSVPPGIETDVVRRGPFQIVLSTSGQLDSARNAVVTNRVEWRTTILSVVPEGTIVKEGDIVCLLDSSRLEEMAKERQIHVTRAEADLRQAQEDLALQEAENERLLAQARLNVELAALDLEKYTEGVFRHEQLKLENECVEAEQTLAQSQEEYDFMRRLSMKGYRSQNELEQARLAVTKSEISLETAEEKQKVLEEYTYKRKVAELEGVDRKARFELERVKLLANLAMLQAKITVKARERRARIHRAYFERLQRNIAACTIRAPKDGQLVHVNDRRGRTHRVLIEEGAEVHFRQELFKFPELGQMKIDVRVHESHASFLKPGLPARIKVDALGGQLIPGTVNSISSVPLAGRRPNYHLREYLVVVHLDPQATAGFTLKPGMSGNVEIIVDHRDAVLQVPSYSVIPLAGRHVAFVATEKGIKRRFVEIGAASETGIEILDGLEEGETIVRSPRTDLADLLREIEAELAGVAEA